MYPNGNPAECSLHPTHGREKKRERNWHDKEKEKLSMLWTLFVILLIAWLIGLVGFHILAWYIHILLVLALVVLIIQLISGRRPVA